MRTPMEIRKVPASTRSPSAYILTRTDGSVLALTEQEYWAIVNNGNYERTEKQVTAFVNSDATNVLQTFFAEKPHTLYRVVAELDKPRVISPNEIAEVIQEIIKNGFEARYQAICDKLLSNDKKRKESSDASNTSTH